MSYGFLISFQFIFPSESPKFLFEWFAFWKCENYLIFWRFSKDILVSFAPVSKVPDFLFEWKAPLIAFEPLIKLTWLVCFCTEIKISISFWYCRFKSHG